MYYYGYNGYGNSFGNQCCPSYGYPAYGGNGGYGAAFILVLFILLVIVFGAGIINYGN